MNQDELPSIDIPIHELPPLTRNAQVTYSIPALNISTIDEQRNNVTTSAVTPNVSHEQRTGEETPVFQIHSTLPEQSPHSPQSPAVSSRSVTFEMDRVPSTFEEATQQKRTSLHVLIKENGSVITMVSSLFVQIQADLSSVLDSKLMSLPKVLKKV